MLESLKYKNSCPSCREPIIIEENNENRDNFFIEESERIINEERTDYSTDEINEFVTDESIINMRYFLRVLYIQQITYNIFFGISYGFGVGCGVISSFLIFYKIFKN